MSLRHVLRVEASALRSLLKRFQDDESGLEIVEWAVVAGLISVTSIAALILIGARTSVSLLILQSLIP